MAGRKSGLVPSVHARMFPICASPRVFANGMSSIYGRERHAKRPLLTSTSARCICVGCARIRLIRSVSRKNVATAARHVRVVPGYVGECFENAEGGGRRAHSIPRASGRLGLDGRANVAEHPFDRDLLARSGVDENVESLRPIGTVLSGDLFAIMQVRGSCVMPNLLACPC